MKDQLPDIFPEPQIERISMKGIGAAILAVLNFERGIFYTLRCLVLSPGETMRTYLFVERKRLLDPVKLLILAVAVYLFFTLNFAPETGFVAGFNEGFDADPTDTKKVEASEKLIAFFYRYANLILLLSVPVAAGVSHHFFRSFRLKYPEHLVLNAYLYGFLSLVAVIFVPLAIFKPFLANFIISIMSLIYSIYFFKDFFKITWGRSILVSFGIFLVSQILYMLLLGIVMIAYVITQFA